MNICQGASAGGAETSNRNTQTKVSRSLLILSDCHSITNPVPTNLLAAEDDVTLDGDAIAAADASTSIGTVELLLSFDAILTLMMHDTLRFSPSDFRKLPISSPHKVSAMSRGYASVVRFDEDDKEWDVLRKNARKLESTLNSKLALYSKMAAKLLQQPPRSARSADLREQKRADTEMDVENPSATGDEVSHMASLELEIQDALVKVSQRNSLNGLSIHVSM